MATDFLFDYFCRPILDGSVQGYNLVNTAVYAIILFVAAAYVVYPLLKNKGIKFDYRFALSLLPFIIFGSSLRVLNDMGLFHKTCNVLDPAFFTFTPGIWIITAVLAVGALLAAKKLAKKNESSDVLFGAIGCAFTVPILIFEFVNLVSPREFVLALLMAILVALAVRVAATKVKKDFFRNQLNFLVMAGQSLDGSATFVATHVQNCGEQHPLSGFVLGVNPFLFVALKVIIALIVVHIIDQEIKEPNTNGFAKVAVMVLGFAPGLRDLLTIGVGTCL